MKICEVLKKIDELAPQELAYSFDNVGLLCGSGERELTSVLLTLDLDLGVIEEAKKLEAYGADLIAIPCNTAHYFYDGVAKETSIPVLNIITETVNYLHGVGVKKAALFATEGTCKSGTYQAVSAGKVEIVTPDEADRDIITSIIFDDIKRGREPDIEKFISVAEKMREGGCERIILGCTELSLIKKNYKQIKQSNFYTDSLEMLARKTVIECGKPCREQI